MSACISRHGEFSEHTLDESHTCTRCHVLDEDALRAELEQARSALAAVEQDRDWLSDALARSEALVAAATTWRHAGGEPGFDAAGALIAAVDEWEAVLDAKPSGTEAGLDPNAPPIESVLHALGDVVLPQPGSTRCPLCGDLPIGHEGECEP